MDDIPNVDEEIRKFWQNQFAEKGLEFIQNELKYIFHLLLLKMNKLLS